VSQVLDRGAQADARGAVQKLDRGAQVVSRGGARCALQVINRGTQADARGDVQILYCSLQAVARDVRVRSARAVASGAATPIADRQGRQRRDAGAGGERYSAVLQRAALSLAAM
jgi:hypothetical protein